MISDLRKPGELEDFLGNEANCLAYLKYRRWKGGEPWCIECGHQKVYKYQDGRTYRCAKCRKKFSITKGTIFEGTRMPLKIWYRVIYDMCSASLTSKEISRKRRFSNKSAWFMKHRIMQLFSTDFYSRKPEIGVWEFDEVYIGVQESKMSKEKILKKEKIAGFGHRTPILAFYNRNTSELFGVVIPVHAGKELTQSYIKGVIHKDSTIYCDKAKEYFGLLDYFADGKQFIHKIKNYGGGKDHSNTIEGSFKHFRRMVDDHVQLQPKYLQRYWDEFCFRYNCRRKKLDEIEMFELAFDNIERPITRSELMEEGKIVKEMMDEAKRKKDEYLMKKREKENLALTRKLLDDYVKKVETRFDRRKKKEVARKKAS